jgi:hypothetical protein
MTYTIECLNKKPGNQDWKTVLKEDITISVKNGFIYVQHEDYSKKIAFDSNMDYEKILGNKFSKTDLFKCFTPFQERMFITIWDKLYSYFTKMIDQYIVAITCIVMSLLTSNKIEWLYAHYKILPYKHIRLWEIMDFPNDGNEYAPIPDNKCYRLWLRGKHSWNLFDMQFYDKL